MTTKNLSDEAFKFLFLTNTALVTKAINQKEVACNFVYTYNFIISKFMLNTLNEHLKFVLALLFDLLLIYLC